MLDRIFIDVDEVFCDFIGGYARLIGVEKWSLVNLLNGNWDLASALKMSQQEFWKPIKDNPQFWLDLEILPWVSDLTLWLDSTMLPWYLVTCPSGCWGTYKGKLDWIRVRFGQTFDNFFITSHRHLFAQPGTLLIDDKLHNCQRFEECGGHTILFPAPTNNLNHVEDPVVWVKNRFLALNPPGVP